jgi:putative addiction module killer protein
VLYVALNKFMNTSFIQPSCCITAQYTLTQSACSSLFSFSCIRVGGWFLKSRGPCPELLSVRRAPCRRSVHDQKGKALIAARLLRLANGLAGDISAVGEGISELGIHYGSGYRVYFQQRNEEIVVLLCGSDKGTQDKDIRTAKKLAAEWGDNND